MESMDYLLLNAEWEEVLVTLPLEFIGFVRSIIVCVRFERGSMVTEFEQRLMVTGFEQSIP